MRAAWTAGVVTAALLVSGAPAAGADERVSSGRLSAEVSAKPWGLDLIDSERGSILTEAPGTALGPTGTLGFRTAAGWFHATRIESAERQGERLTLMVATNDPLGRSLEVTIAPGGEGVISVSSSVRGLRADVQASGIAFEAPPEERYLGFGERNIAADHRGMEVQNHVADGPYQPRERPVIAGFIPPAGFSNRDDATYFPMPWLLSTSGYGVLVENDEDSYFRLGTERADAWNMEADSADLRFLVIAGPEPADVVRRLTLQTGRQPAPRAPWFFGPWYQPHGEAGEAEQAQELRTEDVPASAANTYLHYLPCGDQQGIEDRQPDRTAGFHDSGYAVTTYFNPMLCASYQPAYGEAAQAGVLMEDGLGRPVNYRYSASTDDLFLVGQFDFTAPGADQFFGGLLDEAVGDGYDGWMEDFGEYTPPEAVAHDGTSGSAIHNRYPVDYHCSSFGYAKGQERGVAGFVRSGWTGVQRCAQMVWGGDPTTSFGYDGLQSAVIQALSLGTSGISRWGSDIGGFFALGDNRLTDELLIRWIQFGAVSPVMRTEANGVDVPPQEDRPQISDPEILPIWRTYAKLHTQLYPYTLAADATYRRTGMPAMRHMALSFPDEPAAHGYDDQFMFGPDILAAPVIEQGAGERELYLPKGRWIDFWRSISYREKNGAFRPRAAEVLRGGGLRSVAAPLEQLPMLVRAGAVIPMIPPDVDTLADYGKGNPGVVRLADREGRITLLSFPRGRSKARVGERGKLVSKERKGRWKLKVKGEPDTRYRVRASLGATRSELEPCRLRTSGGKLHKRDWRYNAKEQTLNARFKATGKREKLIVRGC